MNNRLFSKQKSFTLIEMLIVIVIIGILAAALIPRLQSIQGRARDTKRKVDFQQLQTALNVFFTDYGRYPVSRNAAWSCYAWVQYCTSPSHKQTSMTGWIEELQPNYIAQLPVDPLNDNLGLTDARMGPRTYPTFYVYAYVANGLTSKTYTLMTNLENKNDPDRCELRGGTLNDSWWNQSPCVPLAFTSSYTSGNVIKQLYVLSQTQ